MRVAWLECATGISGDMMLAALIDAGAEFSRISKAIDSLGLPGVQLHQRSVMKGGFRVRQIEIQHPPQHAHRHLSDIRELVENASELSPSQRGLALQIFGVIAAAEATVHGSTVEKVHFHEVGAIDSIVDIVGVAVAFDLLGIDRVVCNAVPPGRGFVSIDHGVCPVPAPGTAEILRGIPLAAVPIDAELTTPTGAAFVKVLADSFGPLPAMTIDRIGSGGGSMDFAPRANILRVFIGESSADAQLESVVLLETNVDDVTGETLGFVRERLMELGCLDVFMTPVQMKKNRPGVTLGALVRPRDVGRVEELIFAETGTLGVRRLCMERSIRSRDTMIVKTVWGQIRVKRGWRTGGDATFSPEFDDCAAAARKHGIALRDVFRAAEAAGRMQAASDS
ncbi:MAG: nickel pincer cofactor biosynthesis protein LarC, partial [Planctomycetaceae bacterium]